MQIALYSKDILCREIFIISTWNKYHRSIWITSQFDLHWCFVSLIFDIRVPTYPWGKVKNNVYRKHAIRNNKYQKEKPPAQSLFYWNQVEKHVLFWLGFRWTSIKYFQDERRLLWPGGDGIDVSELDRGSTFLFATTTRLGWQVWIILRAGITKRYPRTRHK